MAVAGLLGGDGDRSAWEKQQTDFGAAKSGKEAEVSAGKGKDADC